MNKSEYVKSLPGKLPEERRKEIEDFFDNELSAGAKAKPTGDLNNYAFIHKNLGWGILRTEGKYGLENTESYQLVKFSTASKFLGMKMGISTAGNLGEVLTGDEIQDVNSIKGITSVSFSLTDSEKEFFEALKNYKFL